MLLHSNDRGHDAREGVQNSSCCRARAFNVDRLVAQTMSQRVFVDLFEMSASKVLVNGKACLPHRVTQGKNVGHGEGTTRGAKGTRITTSLCLMCFLWFLSALRDKQKIQPGKACLPHCCA